MIASYRRLVHHGTQLATSAVLCVGDPPEEVPDRVLRLARKRPGPGWGIRSGGEGKGGAMTTCATPGGLRALRARLTVPGRLEQVATARATVALALSAGHPCADAAVLITSELVANSVVHSDSRRDGGTVTVTVAEDDHGVRIEVTDDG